MSNYLFGQPRYPHSEESLETAKNDSLMPLLELVPTNAFSTARERWMDSAPSWETFGGVLGATALVGTKKSLIESGAVDRRLDFVNMIQEHPEIQGR